MSDVLGHGSRSRGVCATRSCNVLDHVPDRDRDLIKRRLRRAWAESRHDNARATHDARR
jgi:DnaJ-domain-containing protein 1